MERIDKIENYFDYDSTRTKNKKHFESNSNPKAMNQSKMSTECPVCVEAYTGKVRQQVKCHSCSYECCSTCIKTYLLSTSDDPHCMNCRRAWDRDYLYDILTKSFVNTTLRKHRKRLLLEREKSQIPSTQAYVDYLTQKEEKEEQLKDIKAQIQQLRRNYHTVSRQLHDLNAVHNSNSEAHGTNTKLLKCPFPSCRGYLSGSKCNICKHTTCRDCMTITDIDSQGNAIEEEHMCNDDAKKTAQLILKETKGCPGCGERISKVSGCDQMWCTQCNIAFSWTTGKQVTGVIHNPHYYHWLRNNNNAQNPVVRNDGDVVCGGLIDMGQLLHHYGLNHTQQNSSTYLSITRLHRSINHTQHTIVSKSRRKLQHKINERLRNYRAKYMMNVIDEDKWSKNISLLDSERQREQALLHIYETYCTVMTERFNNFAEEGRRTNNFIELFPTFQKEIESFISYLNKQLMLISENYNISYYKFDKNGVISQIKTKAC